MSVLSSEVANLKQLRDMRDRKLSVVVAAARPAWLIDVSLNLEVYQLVFDVIFRPYPGKGWFRRRYRYDGQVDVLHFTGEQPFPESELSKLSEEALIK